MRPSPSATASQEIAVGGLLLDPGPEVLRAGRGRREAGEEQRGGDDAVLEQRRRVGLPIVEAPAQPVDEEVDLGPRLAAQQAAFDVLRDGDPRLLEADSARRPRPGSGGTPDREQELASTLWRDHRQREVRLPELQHLLPDHRQERHKKIATRSTACSYGRPPEPEGRDRDEDPHPPLGGLVPAPLRDLPADPVEPPRRDLLRQEARLDHALLQRNYRFLLLSCSPWRRIRRRP